MNRRYIYLIVILLVLVAAIWINLPSNPGITIGNFHRTLDTVLGLDLRGGLQVLMEADLPQETVIDPESMTAARQILENRSNGLGVSEVVFQIAGTRRIVGEFPGLTNPDEVIATLKETGMLEFVDMGDTPVGEGKTVVTDFAAGSATPAATATPVVSPTSEANATPEAAATPAAEPVVLHTVMTGKDLKSVAVTRTETGQYVISFELSAEGTKIFSNYTTANVGKYLGIVLDKVVISTPSIRNPITEGAGIIEGGFTNESANALAIQLRYGSLPIPLKVVETRVIGPTLGQDSLNKSLVAGLIGFAIVALFMLIYYRLPGAVAVSSIILYALITLSIFKLIPVTLTLPGIAGFLLSTGSALDANILIFERLKEELRGGRTLRQAVDLGWKRAWPSIRDSNIAALITCAILFWFGSSFGATIVKGFAVTLALGVFVSLFTAIIVTRSLLGVVIEWIDPAKRSAWFGV